MKKYLSLLFIFFAIMMVHAQDAVTSQVATVQPKIMVIPYTKEGEDIRTILEDDVNKRIILTKIKEAFDSRSFTTVDFTARLKAANRSKVFQEGTQTDIKTQLIQESGADIYVEAEMSVLLSGSGNAVKIILTAYEISTGNSLANKVGESNKFYTDDIGKLATKAIESCVEDFLNTIQMKFTDIVENGKSVMIDFAFEESSAYTMDSEVGNNGYTLADEIEVWMEQAAYKNNYHIQGTTEKQMIFDDVRIPLKDPVNGRNYNPNKFVRELTSFLRSLGIESTRSIEGNAIHITIK